MNFTRYAITVLGAALLLCALSCNKPATDEADSSAANPCSTDNTATAPNDSAGTSAALPPTDPAEQPCNPDEGSESDGAASARALADFKVRHASGEVKPISEFYGRPLVINFWADWCEPCKEELPMMEAVYASRKDEFDMMAISVESQAAEDFWKTNDYSIPMYHDVDGKTMLGLSGIPVTFFLDSEGKVVGYISRSMSREDFEVNLKTILH